MSNFHANFTKTNENNYLTTQLLNHLTRSEFEGGINACVGLQAFYPARLLHVMTRTLYKRGEGLTHYLIVINDQYIWSPHELDFSTIVSPNINVINKTKYSPLLKRGAGGDLVNRLKNPPEAESLTSRQGAGGKG